MPLRAKVVAFLMNTIDYFTDSHRLAKENTQLRNQLAGLNDAARENTNLREQLKIQGQLKENLNQQPKTPQSNQNGQSDLISFDDSTFQQVPKSLHSNSSKPSTPISTSFQTSVVSHSNFPQESDEDAALRAEIEQYRQKHAQLLERFQKLNAEMKRKKIESFEDLVAHDKETLKILIELARLTEPIPLEGINIGLFGLTSTGKSTMLNKLIGKDVAATGVGETTTKITPYNETQFTLWDVPGRNDEVSYFSMEYISFFKGLTKRLILIQATVRENSSMMKLLDELGLNYDIVFNKFDKVDEEERDAVKQQIQNEVKNLGLKHANKLYFVSARQPQMFPDWIEMINSFQASS